MANATDNVNIYTVARSGDISATKALVESGQDPTLALVGISDYQTELLNGAIHPEDIRKVYKTLSSEQRQQVKDLEAMTWWCNANGSCIVFGMPHTHKSVEKGASFFSRVSMRKGPGDIAKGSFKKD